MRYVMILDRSKSKNFDLSFLFKHFLYFLLLTLESVFPQYSVFGLGHGRISHKFRIIWSIPYLDPDM